MRYKEGARAHRNGELATSERLLEEALQLNGYHVAARFELADLLEVGSG